MTAEESRRMRTLEIGAGAASGLVAGLAAGLAIGWLVFGRDAPPAPPPPDTGPELRRLAESVDRLGAALGRLAEAGGGPLAGARAGEGAQAALAPPPIEPGVKFHDTFEQGTDGWFVARFAPQIIGEVARVAEEGLAKEGSGALALRYTLEPGKLPLVVRAATNVNRLSLWVRTLDRPAELVVTASERDESNYQTMLHLEPAEGWKRLELDLGTFTLSDDSKDENGRLDVHEIRSVGILDVGAFMGGTGPNTILVDDATGEYREGPAPAGGAPGERF